MDYPIAWIRAQFPALGEGRVHLDNAAGAQVPGQVLVAMVEAMTHDNVNSGARYPASQRVSARAAEVRRRTAELIGATSSEFVAGSEAECIAFGPNATTLVSLLSASYGDVLEAGDEVVVTGLDHHANVDPWRRLESRGIVLRTWPTRGPEQRLDVDDLLPLLSRRTAVVAMTAASNALGNLTPVAEAAAAVHAVGARIMVDAVHLTPHQLPDVRELGADMLVFSPYKVFGPHLGVLYLATEVRALLPGHRLSFMRHSGPSGFEIGTQNFEAIAGLGATYDYLDALAAELGVSGVGRAAWIDVYRAIAAHEGDLLRSLLDGLDALGMERYGLPGVDGRTATVAFNHPERSAEEVVSHLGGLGIEAAAGHYYAYGLMMERLGLADRGGAVRVSLVHYNELGDVERLVAALAGL
jgi:cysteine desulfurase family protein (TIGR01976 family)